MSDAPLPRFHGTKQAALDRLIYGTSFSNEMGERVDPLEIMSRREIRRWVHSNARHPGGARASRRIGRSAIDTELRLLYRHPVEVIRHPGMWGRTMKDADRYRELLAAGVEPSPAYLLAIRRGLDRLGFGLAAHPFPEAP